MWNTDYSEQIRQSRALLFGNGAQGHDDCLRMSDEAHKMYRLPAGVKTFPCFEDTNGEWVAEPSRPLTPEEQIQYDEARR